MSKFRAAEHMAAMHKAKAEKTAKLRNGLTEVIGVLTALREKREKETKITVGRWPAW